MIPWKGLLQCSASLLAAAIVAIFPILHFKPILFPAQGSLKNKQQISNIVVTIVTRLVVAIISQCRNYTNIRETAAKLSNGTLTPGRLQSHWAVATSSWFGGQPAFYFLAAVVFLAVNSILSAVFVLDSVLVQPPLPINSTDQVGLSKASIILGSNIDADDPCIASITSANCTYDLAIGALSSALIARTSYQIAGITFNPINGTRGLPYDALQQFVTNSSISGFSSSIGHYCLPILDMQMVSCVQDIPSSRAKYELQSRVNGFDIYTVTVNPDSPKPDKRIRVSYQNGTMTIAQSKIPGEESKTIVTGSGVYADLLSQLTHGGSVNSSEKLFTMVCTIKSVKESTTWQWTRLSYANNTFHAEVPDTNILPESRTCDNGFAKGTTGFIDLYFAIEGATRLVNSIDGNTKYINLDVTRENWNLNSNNGGNMTHLEFILSQLYQITQTTWSSTYSPNTERSLIMALTEKHKYRIRVSWTIATEFALGFAVLVLLFTVLQALRYLKYKRAANQVDCNLLDPLKLLAYGIGNATALESRMLNTNPLFGRGALPQPLRNGANHN